MNYADAPVPPGTRARARREERTGRRRRRTTLWVALSILGLLILAAAWIGVRGLLARDALQSAMPEARTLAEQIIDGDTDAARTTLSGLQTDAARAARLTSDPIWRAAEIIPLLGDNLTAVREAAATVDTLVADAITPLVDATNHFSYDDLKPVDGAIPVQPLLDAQPYLAEAAPAFVDAETRARNIQDDNLIGPVADAVTLLRDTLTDAAPLVDTIARTVDIAPGMLGADGPRTYLMLFQNLAEPRATGGIPGALALLTATNGTLDLIEQASSSDFRNIDEPVLELPPATRSLYGDITGRYIQNVNLTPRFDLSGPLAAEMWRLKFGHTVDGVISIDPVALAHLLDATGPIELATGDTLTADNAVQTLLIDAYERYEDPREQDLYFAAAADGIFTAMTDGDLDPLPLIDALARAGNEHRILLWSAHEHEQQRLAETTLAGALPTITDQHTSFGLYLNDATGSKMGPYLDVASTIGSRVCREDGRAQYVIETTYTNTAPADAATSLPRYVTGGGAYGVTPGNIRVMATYYAPAGMLNLGLADGGGSSLSGHSVTDGDLPASSHVLELAPGETATVRASFLGEGSQIGDLRLIQTPQVNEEFTEPVTRTCENP